MTPSGIPHDWFRFKSACEIKKPSKRFLLLPKINSLTENSASQQKEAFIVTRQYGSENYLKKSPINIFCLCPSFQVDMQTTSPITLSHNRMDVYTAAIDKT